MRLNGVLCSVMLVLSGVLASPAMAGRACEEGSPTAENHQKASQMAERLQTQLNAEKDDVVLLGLAGQDLSAYGVEYSHMAFAVRKGSEWRVVHALNLCGTAESALFEHSLLAFFSDRPFQYKAGLWRLQPSLQDRLLKALSSKAAKRMHEPRYSLAAYPFSTQFQNTSGWVLEMLAYALATPADDVVTRQDAQSWLKAAGYAPTELPIGMLSRLGARMAQVNVAFEDHPPALRWTNRIQTTTAESVIAFLVKTPGACGVANCPQAVVALPPPVLPVAPSIPVQALGIAVQHAATFADNNLSPYVAVGDSNQLSVVASPAQALSQLHLEWRSSDASVVAVDPATGRVTGVAAGAANITVEDTASHVASPPVRFTTYADVVAAGLTWKITPLRATYSEAVNYCTAKGWRLPTLTEARVVRMGSALTGELPEPFDGAFDSWRHVSEFRTSSAGAARQHLDWYWYPKGGPARPIDLPDAVRSQVVCVN